MFFLGIMTASTCSSRHLCMTLSTSSVDKLLTQTKTRQRQPWKPTFFPVTGTVHKGFKECWVYLTEPRRTHETGTDCRKLAKARCTHTDPDSVTSGWKTYCPRTESVQQITSNWGNWDGTPGDSMPIANDLVSETSQQGSVLTSA